MTQFDFQCLDIRVVLAVLMICGCNGRKEVVPLEKKSVSKSEVRFEDFTKATGLSHVYRNGEESNEYTYLEAMGGGLAILDYDRDGYDDLVLPGGGKIESLNPLPLPNQLSRNREGSLFEDVSVVSGVHLSRFYTQGAACGDMNNDGFGDVVITGYGGLQLFLNRGDGTFEEVAVKCGIDDSHWSTSAAFGDLDRDGLLDMYIAHYVDWSPTNHPICNARTGLQEICPPAAFQGVRDVIFWNRGDGTFGPSESAELVAGGKGLGVLCADFDKDEQLDIYVANDTTNNFLYSNRGERTLEEVGIASGVALDDQGKSNGSMGIAVLDYDGDLNLDMWVCNYEDETFALYKNDGQSHFRYVSSSTGVTSLGHLFVAFGVVAADFDQDGDEDIVVTNGHVLRAPSNSMVAQSPLFVENLGTNRFQRRAFDPNSFFSQKWRGRGVVRFDLEKDGDVDLAFSNVNEPTTVLANQSANSGTAFVLDLVGTISNRDGIGASVVLTTNNRKRLRTVYGGGSYMSQSSYSVHFGIPKDERILQIEIQWPSGVKQRLDGPFNTQSLKVVEHKG